MADGQLSVVLRHVHKLMGAQALEELTDGQLLERFISRQEEAAFAALVRRHGPMVLGVCRRVLHHWHAAEDAFQATFLVLFRRARSLDRRGSVANWLYTVAYHVALKARANAAHRSLRERQVVEMPQAETQPDEVWRDLQPVLDEELSSLPDKYRAPIVLCYVEGKTNAEAARLLGWPIGTVKGRLSRARELLRTRLGRRGITLSTGLLGVVLAEHASAAVPGLLVDSTIKTIALLAAGKATTALAAAPAAVLAEGVLKAMFATKLKIATALLLAVGVLGMGVGTVTQQVLAQRQSEASARPEPPPVHLTNASSQRLAQAKSKPPATPAASSEPKVKNLVRVMGRVLDAGGKPVANADLAVLGQPAAPLRGPRTAERPGEALAQGKADAEGHFRLTIQQTSKDRFQAVFVFARAPGQALGWREIDADLDHAVAEVRLPRERILRGRLIDLQGQAAANVKVHVVRIVGPLSERYRPLLKSDRPPGGLACLPEPVTTDAQGRFGLRGLDGTLSVTIELQDDRFARQELEIKPPDLDGRAEITFALAPARVLEGTVICADTGKPVPNARLGVRANRQFQEYDRICWAETQSDEQGRFRVIPHVGNDFAGGAARMPAPLPGAARMPALLPPLPAASFTVTAYPPAGEPYLAVRKELNWPKADVIKHAIDLALPRGVVVRGTVTEAASGKPVAGGRVEFEPQRNNNPFYRDDVIRGQSSTSGPDGRFQLTVLPGPGHLLINGPTLDYLHVETTHRDLYGDSPNINRRYYPDALVPLNLKPDAGTHAVAVTLRRGVTLSGRVVGPDGKPISQAEMICRSFIPYGYILTGEPSREVKDGRFELLGCDPEKTAEVFFFDHKNRLGTVAQLSGKDAGKSVTVTLQPVGSATARILNEDGKSIRDFQVFAVVVVTPGVPLGDFWPASQASKIKGPAADIAFGWSRDAAGSPNFSFSDAQGRITFPSLIPGATYWLMGNIGLTNLQKEFQVEPGKTLDLGDITIKQPKNGAP
jgi:RNA polymerase sigma factor (sigma-70 family)